MRHTHPVACREPGASQRAQSGLSSRLEQSDGDLVIYVPCKRPTPSGVKLSGWGQLHALVTPRLSRKWDRRCVIYEPEIDTTLIPPGTQYGATLGKVGKRNRPIYAGFATSGRPLQHLNYHS